MRISHATMLALSTSFLAFPAVAQVAPKPAAPAADAAVLPGQEIIVTGTRAANRTVADSPVPVDVITAQALTTGGAGDTNTALNALVPSFNFPRPSIADGSDVIRPATLRGLSPDQTLVLVNGKRRHVSALLNVNGTVGRGSAAVDLNTLPALAVERIEVLRDGASSQYGSDAIAGVINVRLKTADHGGKASVTYGKYVTKLDGVAEVLGLQTNAGQPFLEPNDSRYLVARLGGRPSRNDGDTWTLGMNIGVPIGEGFLNVTGEYRDRDTVNRAGYDLRPNYNRVGGAFDARELTFNRLNFQLGDPKTEDYTVVVNAGAPVGGGWEAYAFGTFANRNGRSAANWRQGGGDTNRDWSVLAPSQAPNSANFRPIYADGFLPFIASVYKDYSIAGGVKGDIGAWAVDLSAVYGHNRIDYRTENSINVSLGPTGPRNVDAGGIRFSQMTANLDVTREFELGLAKPLTLAFGGEFRRENFRQRPGQVESYVAGPYFVNQVIATRADCAAMVGWTYNATTNRCVLPGRQAAVGQQGFGGIPATARTNNSRNSFAGYLELDTDIVEGFTVTAAGRFERYTDFGNTVNGKLAARYEIIPQLSVRGAISNGFRAPSLHQQFFTTTSTNFISGVPVDIVTAQVGSPVARALGATPLKPEKSRNISAGVTVNPFRGFNLTADFFHIRIRDRIVLTENLGTSGTGPQNRAVEAVLVANGFNSIGAARFFINGLDTTTKGVDVVGTYHINGGAFGNWQLSAAYNYTDQKIDRRINNLGPLAQIPGLVLFGRGEGLRFTEGQPRDKIVLSANGEISAFGVTARTTRYGRVVAPDTGTAPLGADAASLTAYGPNDIFLRPKWITDIEVRYTFKEHMTFSIGADNVFDVYPTRSPFGKRPDGGNYPNNQGYIAYSGFSPFGFNGRYLYGRFTAQF